MRRHHLPGFTLLEILLVLGILGVLAAIVLVAINPTKQLEDTKDASRRAAIREIGNATAQYIIDGHSILGLPANKANAKDICQSTLTGSSCTGGPVNGVDLSALTPTYVVGMPVDPALSGSTVTGYRIYRNGSFIQVCSHNIDPTCGP